MSELTPGEAADTGYNILSVQTLHPAFFFAQHLHPAGNTSWEKYFYELRYGVWDKLMDNSSF